MLTMKILFAPPKHVTEVKKERRTGRFSLSSDPLTWVGCRDHFLNVFRADSPGFFMTIPSGEHEKVPAFVLKTEEIIDINSLGFTNSRFALTNRSYVIWIDPSLFWRGCEMRRSFFSALLRAGLEYHPEKNNYEEALYKRDYFRTTKSATIRFLFGHTEFASNRRGRTASSRGWVSAFAREDEKSVRRKLLLPEDRNKCTSLIGVGSLWR